MKLKWTLSLIIIILLLTGCRTDSDQAVSTSGEAMQNSPVDTAETTPPQPDHEFILNGTLDKEAIMASYRQNQLGTAQSMAQLYIDAIKNGLDLANNEDAIEMFDLLFNRQTLAVTNLRLADNEMPDGYQCDIVGSGPNGERIAPLFIIFQQDDPRFSCPLPRYGKQSRSAVETYLNYLFEGDAAKLSRWLSDDLDSSYLLDEANRLIEYYRQYDLSKMEIVNFDYNNETNRFVYRVQDGNEEEFEIFLSYGDGFSMPDINSVLDSLADDSE